MSIFFTIKQNIPGVSVFVILFYLAACSEKETNVATGKSLGADLTEEQMIEVLSELHLAEAFVQLRPKPEKDSLLEVYYHQIFENHELTEADFERNMTIYFSDPVVADLLYERVIDNLATLEVNNVGKRKTGKDGPPPRLEDEGKKQ